MDAGLEHVVLFLLALDLDVVDVAARLFRPGQHIFAKEADRDAEQGADHEQRKHRALDADPGGAHGHALVVFGEAVHQEKSREQDRHRRGEDKEIGDPEQIIFEGEVQRSAVAQKAGEVVDDVDDDQDGGEGDEDDEEGPQKLTHDVTVKDPHLRPQWMISSGVSSLLLWRWESRQVMRLRLTSCFSRMER